MSIRSVAVTGGGSGIGRAIALAFAGAGHPVHVGDISQARVEDTVVSADQGGGPLRAHVLDVTDLAAVEAFTRAADEDPDGEGLGVFVNCAGVFDGYAGVDETSPDPPCRTARIFPSIGRPSSDLYSSSPLSNTMCFPRPGPLFPS